MEPLEVAITLKGDSPDAFETFRSELSRRHLPGRLAEAEDVRAAQQGSESDLLHFTIHDAQGSERVMLPVFTQPEIMRAALARNPDWQTLSVLQVQGQALLDHVHPDVFIVINPWSRLEYQLPPTGRTG
jgi:hypothetical protein